MHIHNKYVFPLNAAPLYAVVSIVSLQVVNLQNNIIVFYEIYLVAFININIIM